MDKENILEMKDIGKSFNGVPVLEGVNFSVKKGEVHALCGGNGAGKSTLMKILTGIYTKDVGEIFIEGKKVDICTPNDSESNGISMIFQEFSLIPTLTVLENLFLNREHTKGIFIDKAECLRKAKEVFQKLNIDIDLNVPVNRLGVGYRQMVEIAKAILMKNTKILIMDEPTASLTETETSVLFKIVKDLKESGISIIYISHRLSEILKICDKVTVLKDGGIVLAEASSNLTISKVVHYMVGNNVENFRYIKNDKKIGEKPVLQVEHLTYKQAVKDVSFKIYPGEVLGLAGLMGSGRTEIARCLFGIEKKDSGSILIGGKQISNIKNAIKNGLVLVPEDRRAQGLVLNHSIKENMILPTLTNIEKRALIDKTKCNLLVNKYVSKLNIVTDSPNKAVKSLSGGNQQKIVFAKWLALNPKVFVLDEPTIGVDIAAKAEIVETIRKMANEGAAVLVISSEFEELLAISDRLLIMRNGKIITEIQREEIMNEEELHNAVHRE